MGDSGDLLNLPPDLQSDGDPVEGNPFRKEDPRHEVWKEATRVAAGKLHLLHSSLLKSFPKAPEDANSWRVNLAAAKFDIWAERNVRVVWSDDAVLEYDQWLASYANAWMKLFKERFSALIDLDSLLHELRVRLVERIEFWRGIARTEMRSASLLGPRSASEVRDAPKTEVASPRQPKVTAPVQPATLSTSVGHGRKRGPKPDYENAKQVYEVVARVAPDGDWRSKLDEVGEALYHGVCNASDPKICDASDHEKIQPPLRWRKKHNHWLNPPDRATMVKAIEYRLEIVRKKPTSETLA